MAELTPIPDSMAEVGIVAAARPDDADPESAVAPVIDPTNGALVNPVTGTAPMTPCFDLVIAGDSITKMNRRYFREFSGTEPDGLRFLGANSWFEYIGTSNSTGSVRVNPLNRTLEWKAPSDSDYGTPVAWRNGVVECDSSTTGRKALFGVRMTKLAATVTSTTAYNVTVSGDRTTGWSPRCHVELGNQLLMGRFNIVGAFGVGGDKAVDVYNRIDQIIAALPRGGYCAITIGTNSSFDSVDTAASVLADIQNIINALLAANITPIISTVFPRFASGATSGTASFETDAWIAQLMALNTAIAALASPRVIIVDPWARMASSSAAAKGGPVDNYTIDGVHLNGIAAYKYAQSFYNALYPIVGLGRPRARVYDTLNLLTNPFLTGTAGTNGTGSSGDVADSWTSAINTSTGTTAVCTKVARTDGVQGEIQQMVITNGSGSEQTFNFRQTLTFATVGLAAGDIVGVEFEIVAITSPVTLKKISAQIYHAGSPAFISESCAYVGGGVDHDGQARASPILLRSYPTAIPTGPTAMDARIAVTLSAGGSVAIQIGRAWCGRVSAITVT